MLTQNSINLRTLEVTVTTKKWCDIGSSTVPCMGWQDVNKETMSVEEYIMRKNPKTEGELYGCLTAAYRVHMNEHGFSFIIPGKHIWENHKWTLIFIDREFNLVGAWGIPCPEGPNTPKWLGGLE